MSFCSRRPCAPICDLVILFFLFSHWIQTADPLQSISMRNTACIRLQEVASEFRYCAFRHREKGRFLVPWISVASDLRYISKQQARRSTQTHPALPQDETILKIYREGVNTNRQVMMDVHDVCIVSSFTKGLQRERIESNSVILHSVQATRHYFQIRIMSVNCLFLVAIVFSGCLEVARVYPSICTCRRHTDGKNDSSHCLAP